VTSGFAIPCSTRSESRFRDLAARPPRPAPLPSPSRLNLPRAARGLRQPTLAPSPRSAVSPSRRRRRYGGSAIGIRPRSAHREAAGEPRPSLLRSPASGPRQNAPAVGPPPSPRPASGAPRQIAPLRDDPAFSRNPPASSSPAPHLPTLLRTRKGAPASRWCGTSTAKRVTSFSSSLAVPSGSAVPPPPPPPNVARAPIVPRHHRRKSRASRMRPLANAYLSPGDGSDRHE